MRAWIRVLVYGVVTVTLVTAGLLALLAWDPALGWLLPRLASAAGYRLGAAEVRHELGRRLIIQDLTFGASGYPPLLHSRALDLRYRLWGLLSGGPAEAEIRIQEPTVDLVFREDGSLSWPPSEAAPEEAEDRKDSKQRGLLPSLPVSVRLEKLELTDGSVRADRSRAGAPVLELSGIRLTAKGLLPMRLEAILQVARAEGGAARIGPLDARARVEGEKASVDRLGLRVRDGGLELAAAWDRGSGSVDARLELNRLDLAPLLAMLGSAAALPILETGEATLGGRIPDALRANLELHAAFRGEDLRAAASAEGALNAPLSVLLKTSVSSDAVLEAAGTLDLEGDRTDLRLQGQAATVAAAGRLAGLPDLEGTDFRLAAKVRGALAAPEVELEQMSLARASFRRVRIVSLRAEGALASAARTVSLAASFDELGTSEVALGPGKLDVSGSLDRPEARLVVGSSLDAHGAYEPAGRRIRAEVAVDALPLDPFLELAGLGEVRGVLGRLRAEANGPLQDLTALRGQARVEGLEVRSEDGTRISQAGPLVMSLAGGNAKVQGAFTAGRGRLGIEGGMALVGERTLDMSAASRLELSDFAGFARASAPGLETLRGGLTIDAVVKGRLEQPSVDLKGAARDLEVVYALGEEEPAKEPAKEPEKEPGKEPRREPPRTRERVRARIAEVDLSLSGPLARLSGSGKIAGGNAAALGHQVRDLTIAGKADDGAYVVESLAVRLDGVALSGQGRLARDGTLAGKVRTVSARLEGIPEAKDAGLSGALSLGVDLAGNMRMPRIEARLSMPSVFHQGSLLGSMTLAGTYAERKIDVQGELPGGGKVLARLDLSPPSPFSVSADVPDLVLDPYLKLIKAKLPARLADAAARVALAGNLDGRLGESATYRGSLRIEEIDASAAGTRLWLEAPAQATLRDRTLTLERMRLRAGQGSVELAGSFAPAELRAALKADLEPSVANLFMDGVRFGPGKVTADLSVRRARGVMEGRGQVRAAVEHLEAKGLSTPIEDIVLAGSLEGDRFTLGELRARVGDGELRGDALVELEGPSISRSSFTFVELPYRVPGTLRVLTSGELTADGSPEEMHVRGTIRIDDALYERDVEILQGLIQVAEGSGGGRAATSKPPSPFLQRILLDLEVYGGEQLRVRNNVAAIVMAADLSVGGSAAQPRLLGEVRVAEGTLKFFGRTFEIEEGTIAFNDPLRIDPTIRFETQTTVEREEGDVDVTLELAGTASAGLALKLASNPTYPEGDIVFLLATGMTRTEALASGGMGTGGSGGLPMTAMNLFLGREAKERFGVEQFKVAETETGGVQVTVGKRLSERMSIRTTNEFRGQTPGLAVEVNYQLTDKVFLVAEPQSTGAFEGGIRFRFKIR
ncbi:MAG: translocation/assembly module TamB domain-containing protein [bacterium]